MSQEFYHTLLLTVFVLQVRVVLTDITDGSSSASSDINSNTMDYSSSPTPTVSPLLFVNEDKLVNDSSLNATDVIVKIMTNRCSKVYSLTCFKLDMIRLVNKLGHVPSYQLYPGISLVHLHSVNDWGLKGMPDSLIDSLAKGNNSNELDNFLASSINNYLNSFTLSVKLLDQTTIAKAKEIGEDLMDRFSKDVQKGRKKGYGGAFWAAGTIATLGMAGLAAMAGKALMTSMLALVLAAAGAMKGGGNGSGNGGDKCAHHYITAHGRNMDEQMQQSIDQKHMDLTTGSNMLLPVTSEPEVNLQREKSVREPSDT